MSIQERIRTLGEKENLELSNIESGFHETRSDERKK